MTAIKTNMKVTKGSCRGPVGLQSWTRYCITLDLTAPFPIISLAIISLLKIRRLMAERVTRKDHKKKITKSTPSSIPHPAFSMVTSDFSPLVCSDQFWPRRAWGQAAVHIQHFSSKYSLFHKGNCGASNLSSKLY